MHDQTISTIDPATDGGPLLKEDAVASMLGYSAKTIRDWRWKKIGPRYVKLFGGVRYRADDVREFLNERSVTTAAPARAVEA